MKRALLYMILIAAVLNAPVTGTDVGKLRPVQVIELYRDHGEYVIETDTGDRGVGSSGMDALRDLKETTPANIYLDTANHLLIGEDTDGEVEKLRPRLKPNVKVCRVRDRVDPKMAGEYLRVHQELPRLKVWKQHENLPILEQFGERLKLLKKDEKRC